MRVIRRSRQRAFSTAMTILIIVVVIVGSMTGMLLVLHSILPQKTPISKVLAMDGGLGHWTDQVVYTVNYNFTSNGAIPMTEDGRYVMLSYRAELGSVMDVGGTLTNNGTVGITPALPTISCVESDIENSSYSALYASSSTDPLDGFHFSTVSCSRDLSIESLDWTPTFLSRNENKTYNVQITVNSTSFSPHAMLISLEDYVP